MTNQDFFNVGDDILDLIDSFKNPEAKWDVLEWSADFFKRTNRPAHVVDLFRERPSIGKNDGRKAGQ